MKEFSRFAAGENVALIDAILPNNPAKTIPGEKIKNITNLKYISPIVGDKNGAMDYLSCRDFEELLNSLKIFEYMRKSLEKEKGSYVPEGPVKISDVAILLEANLDYNSPQEIYDRMVAIRYVMGQISIEEGLKLTKKSRSGVSGALAHEMNGNIKESIDKYSLDLLGSLALMVVKAIAVAELNEQSGIIVTAPTAGSSGIVPTLITVYERYKDDLNLTEDDLIQSLFTLAMIGSIIGLDGNACFSGTIGCQGECGIAQSMLAAGIAQLLGGTPEQVVNAAKLSMVSYIGLTCDAPPFGVEVPCIRRNALYASGAYAVAIAALSGAKVSIPSRDLFRMMMDVGNHALPPEVREGGNPNGGLAGEEKCVKIREERDLKHGLSTYVEDEIERLHYLSLSLLQKPISEKYQILLSATLFNEVDRNRLTKRLGEDYFIKILDPREIRNASMNSNSTKKNLACIISKDDYNSTELWNKKHEGNNKSTMLILNEDLKGPRYLYLEGVVGLARAMMIEDNARIISNYLDLLFEKRADDNKLIELLLQNPIEFIKYIKFKPITPFNNDNLPGQYKMIVENYLIQA